MGEAGVLAATWDSYHTSGAVRAVITTRCSSGSYFKDVDLSVRGQLGGRGESVTHCTISVMLSVSWE